MNLKPRSSLYFIPLAYLANAQFALAEEQKHLCPDMSQHERVLNEGMKMNAGHSHTNFSFRDPPMFPPPRFVNDYTPSRRAQDLRASLRWLEESVDSFPLTSLNKRATAEQYAEQFEELGMYAPAEKLYGRLLAFQLASADIDQHEMNRASRNLERPKLCESASAHLASKHYSEALRDLDKVVKNIETSDFDLLSKSNMLKPVVVRINMVMQEQDCKPGLTPKEVTESQQTKARADNLANNWKRELECLGMAKSLDRTAWNLERGGELAMAEKLYKQSLMIKQKNLGADDPETLAQNADFARLCAEKGRTNEACQYYEAALKGLRKLPNPGRTYVTILESYGDMLDRMKDKTRAEQIYEEARNYHEKLGTIKN